MLSRLPFTGPLTLILAVLTASSASADSPHLAYSEKSAVGSDVKVSPELGDAQKFNVWAASDAHVTVDSLYGVESLKLAIQQSEGFWSFLPDEEKRLAGIPPAFDWDTMINLGDFTSSQFPPRDGEGIVLVDQYQSISKHYREDIYTVSGNHDSGYYDDGAGSWFRKWSDPLGENTAFSGVDSELRRFPIEGTWERYKFEAGNTANSGVTVNGDARIQGIEFDFEALLSENWRVSGGVSYAEAEFQDGANIPCNDGVVPNGTVLNTCDVGGLELGSQPRFSMSISNDYSIPFDAFEGYVQALYKFTGRRTDLDAPSGDLGGYSTVDLHLGLRDAGDAWDLSLFARNLFDKQATEVMFPEFLDFTGAGTGYKEVQVIPQRLVGISASYSF